MAESILTRVRAGDLGADGGLKLLNSAIDQQQDDAAAEVIRTLKPDVLSEANLDFSQLLQKKLPATAVAFVKHGVEDIAGARSGPLEGTFLHAAVDAPGAAQIVESLVAAGVPVNATNKAGDSALHLAAMAGSVEVCDALCTAGANPLQRNNKGRTPRSQVKVPESTKAFLLDAEEAEKTRQTLKSSTLWDDKMKATQTESAFIIRTI